MNPSVLWDEPAFEGKVWIAWVPEVKRQTKHDWILCSTVSAFDCIYLPPCILYKIPMFHHQIPKLWIALVPEVKRLTKTNTNGYYVPLCLHSTASIFHHVCDTKYPCFTIKCRSCGLLWFLKSNDKPNTKGYYAPLCLRSTLFIFQHIAATPYPCFTTVCRLVGLVVKSSATRAADLGSITAFPLRASFRAHMHHKVVGNFGSEADV